VLDASRVVGVVSALLDPARAAVLDADNRAEQARMRELHAGKRVRPVVPLARARSRRPRVTFGPEQVAQPAAIGRFTLGPEAVGLADIARYIDWTFFFTAWQLKGRFPAILEHETYGAAARELYAHGRELLAEIVASKALEPRAVYGLWPAASEGDDIVLYADRERSVPLTRFSMLRQQQSRAEDAEPMRSLADYVAPRDAGVLDHVGAFAVTTGIGADALARRYEAEHDDYRAIMVKAIADRLAEAYAELLHARVRREWGYERDGEFTLEELHGERYRGIRPAFGYPACPDHTEKGKLFELLRAPEVGITLTESFAMSPAASVSGLMLAHPDARYFSIGRIGRDQVEDYAARKAMAVSEVERWLSPSLGYDADEDAAPESGDPGAAA